MRKFFTAAVVAALTGLSGVAQASEGGEALPEVHWSWNGIFGTFDRAALQRGFQIYNDVCSACHSLHLLSYRNLSDIGFDEEQIKQIAAAATITDGPNDEGEMFERPGLPSDRFKSPFANPQAARAANNGALPPDLSLIIKARVGGADYLHGILTGYSEPPADMKMAEGMNYNKFFPGHQIAMPQPLTDGAVTYADGTEATLDQEARDVATFLAWAAEPETEHRKETGVGVLLFLVLLSAMMFATKKKIWSELH
ncbi:MAG TPA: cytochrome c1 [Verrucomicrobiae bacterium]|nr:cytochrome c1 [Verrucomicrobiae bacterium]